MWSPSPIQTIPVQFQRDVQPVYRGYPQSFRIEACASAGMVSGPDALSQTCVRQVVRHPPAGFVRPGAHSPCMARPPVPAPLPKHPVVVPHAPRPVQMLPGAKAMAMPPSMKPMAKPVAQAVAQPVQPVPMRTCPVASPCFTSRVVVRAPSPSPMSPARALHALSPARVRQEPSPARELRRQERSPMKARVLEVRKVYPVTTGVQKIEPEPREAQPETETTVATVAPVAPVAPAPVAPVEAEATKAASELQEPQGADVERESQGSTQASEMHDELRRQVRPLPPRPLGAAPEVPSSATAVEPLLWQMQPDKHPSEAESERSFLNSCLKDLAESLDQHGGLQPYLIQRNQLSRALSKAKGDLDAAANATMQMIRFALEEIVQERLRNGGQNLFVQEGWMMSMGNKKVVKLSCRCEGAEGKLSICWDWDVKLEGK